MKLGVTVRFQNSYFSGSPPQVALAIAKAFQSQGHDVTLLYPQGEPSWFIDVQTLQATAPPRKAWSSDLRFDTILEVVWSLGTEDREKAAKHVIGFAHYPPVFHDMESCVYTWNPTQRNFKGLSALMTYDHYGKQDVRYLEFLSNLPVVQVPYVWDSAPIDAFIKENGVPTWEESAKRLEAAIPKDHPPTLSWCARIVESNFSNSSHCIIPLNIVSHIRAKGDPIRFSVHNAEQTAKSEFFKANVVRNLVLPDISGNLVPRVRLPDLRREKTVFVAHQRFRPIKSFLLDALYMGIPMIHNCAMLKPLGAPYYYELNQITEGRQAFLSMKDDYAAGRSFFHPKTAEIRRAALHSRFSPALVAAAYTSALTQTRVPRALPPSVPIALATTGTTTTTTGTAIAAGTAAATALPELRVAFCDLWDQFQPHYNFFLLLLSWVGEQNGIKVTHDPTAPNLVFFGPLSKGSESKYPGVAKVYFTGENAPPNTHADTFLNLGYQYQTGDGYIRLPLWVTELNWFGADPVKMVNPKPIALKDAMRVDPALLDAKTKFCAFVATNPNNPNRNAAFQILNQWRGVDSGGRLFCNLPGGPIPAGLGGGGGEQAKVDFYKQYKFALTFENSSAPGYTTEKLFHAKVAGCVPIYWGDPFVDRDFDPKGYVNVNQISTPADLIQAVQAIAEDPEKWRSAASVPALSEFKRATCERLLTEVAKRIFQRVLNKSTAVPVEAWKTAEQYGPRFGQAPLLATIPALSALSALPPLPPSPPSSANSTPAVSRPTSPTKRLFVTAANAKYAEAAVNAIASLRAVDPTSTKIVYVWPDVPAPHRAAMKQHGATEVRELPTTNAAETPWADFWDPQHFAWKLWVLQNVLQTASADTCCLYLDAGTVVAAPLNRLYDQIDATGILLLEDEEHTNERWCHPTFRRQLAMTQGEADAQQLWAGCVGFKQAHSTNRIFEEALRIAKTQRDTIVGAKWNAYSATCRGHRHDQSILSLLTQRAAAPRLPLRTFYCDVSMREAKQRGLPLYVHRGQYKELVPFADGIDEAYVINLEKRNDRLASFQATHPTIQRRVYPFQATDGRSLALTTDLIHLFRDNDFRWKKSVMGCALSHKALWEKLAADRLAKAYLILEDDVRLESAWLTQWQQASRHIPKDADVIYLGGVLPPNKPAFPSITEPVNSYFARVAKNTLFGGPGVPPRRYFHFCNYAYVLTQQGARKLVALIQEKGLFTSGDHMIVNHGDALLNIYFTTPLVATCFQEQDPVYQRSEFNNFSRVDNFDSDLWNNTECFSQQEVLACSAGVTHPPSLTIEPPAPPKEEGKTPSPPESARDTSVSESKVDGKAAAATHEERVAVWNTFLQRVALNDAVRTKDSLVEIFAIWRAMDPDEFTKRMAWFRLFEQLIVTKHATLLAHKAFLIDQIRSTFDTTKTILWNKALEILTDSPVAAAAGIALYSTPPGKRRVIHHMSEIDPSYILETQWLATLFDTPIEYKALGDVFEFADSDQPTLLYQGVPGKDVSAKFTALLALLQEHGKQITLLHLSDEFGKDDIALYKSPVVKKVLRNYWRPDLQLQSNDSKIVVLPLGFANDRGAQYLPASPSFAERPHLWAFAGSLDRPGRAEALATLRSATPFQDKSKPNWSAPSILDGQAYRDQLRHAKFVPCFRGSRALESYRLYEALEHGAIPFYVPSESSETKDEFTELYGKHPLLGFPSWAAAAEMLPKLAQNAAVMEKHRATLHTWWKEKKADMRKKLA